MLLAVHQALAQPAATTSDGQSHGGSGGSQSGEGGSGGTYGQDGTAAATASLAGGGGNGPDSTNTPPSGGKAPNLDYPSGSEGGDGGLGGASSFIGAPSAFQPGSAYGSNRANAGQAGSDNFYDTFNNTAVDLGGGGGGAGGYGAVVAGTGAFGTVASIQGGMGGAGGAALFNQNATGGYGTGSYTGGNGGDGGVGVSIDRGEQFTVSPSTYGVIGGMGGSGGAATSFYGTGATGFGGAGGTGGNGILLLGPPALGADNGPSTVIINAGGKVTGGTGGAGDTSSDVEGAGGSGGAGIWVVNGGVVRNAGTVAGGQGSSTGGTAGAGGTGIYGTGITITNTGTINGGLGGSTNGVGAIGGTAITGTSISLDNSGTLTGGAGGSVFAGTPGAGADAISLSNSSIFNEAGGQISGGALGTVFTRGGFRNLALAGPSPTGGVAITGSSLTVTNAGTITGALTGQNYAVTFTGGVNTLILYPTYTITGGVSAASALDTLALGGPGNGTFDTSQIGGSATTFYAGFGVYKMIGTGTWTLTNTPTTTADTPWQILSGVLAVAQDASLGASTGPVTLNGGTLEATSSTTSTRTFVLGAFGGGIETDAGAVLALNGTINDNGTNGVLIKSGQGTLILNNTNAYTGGTVVEAGAVGIGNAGGLGTGKVTFAPGTTLAFLSGFTFGNAVVLAGPGASTVDTGGNADTMSGAITGAGSLTKTGIGILTLTGSNSYVSGTKIVAGEVDIATASGLGSGTVTMAAGTTLGFLNSFTFLNGITFSGTGDPTINTGSNNDTISGPINGPDALTKTGSGTLTLSGTNGYTGPTTVAQGTLIVNGSTAGSVVTVESGTALGGFGTVGGIVAQSGSTVAPGFAGSPSTLHVTGNVTFQSGSTYLVQVNGTSGTTDAITATGTATLAGGTVAAVTTGTFTAGQAFTILTAAGGRTGTFNALTTSTNFAFLTPQLVYDPTHVILTFVANGTTPGQIASNPNQQTTGNASTPTIFGLIQGLTIPQAQQALSALSGDAHASVETAAVQAAEIVSTTIFDRLWNIGGATGDAYDVLRGFGAPLPTLLRCYAPGDSTTREILSSYSVWAVGLGDFGHFSGGGGAASLDTSLGGFIGGVDMPIYAGATIWRFGVAGGYSNDDITVRDRGASGTFESAFGTLYGGVRAGAFDARFGAGAAANSTSLQRTVAFPGFNQGEHSSYGGTTVQGFGEIGYRFSFNQKVIEPVAGFTAISVHQDSFREDGGIAALNGRARDTNVQTSELGFRAEATPFASLPLVARIHLAWQHSFGDLNPASIVAFQAGGSNFEVTGAPIDHNAALIEAGADYRATGAFTVGLNYVGTIGPRDQDHSIRGRMEYRF